MFIISRAKKVVVNKISNYRYNRAQSRAVHEYFDNIADSSLPELTSAEKNEIINKWRGIIPNPRIGFHAYRIFKKFREFDSSYIPEPFFYPYIIRRLNPTQDYISLPNKCLNDALFCDLNRPKTIFRKSGSNIISGDFLSIDFDEAVELALKQKSDLIIKPAKDTNSGRGVKLINSTACRSDIVALLSEYNSDFIVQKRVEQSAFTAQFNPTSLNTIRAVTLFINSRISLCYAILKLGSAGRIVDNGANGGLWVGIQSDGTLNSWGTDFKCNFSKSHNGISFDSIETPLPSFDKIKELAFNAHMRIPMCGLVAWDIALDTNNNPLLIEANLWWPATSYGEICSGPAFGDRTSEVIEYLKEQQLSKVGLLNTI